MKKKMKPVRKRA